MGQLEVAEKSIAPNALKVPSAYVPSLQRTEGQAPPVAAHEHPGVTSGESPGDIRSTNARLQWELPAASMAHAGSAGPPEWERPPLFALKSAGGYFK